MRKTVQPINGPRFLAGKGQGIRQRRSRQAAQQHGGLMWGLDAVQPQGYGALLHALYEALSETPVAAAQWVVAPADDLAGWLEPCRQLPFPVLATEPHRWVNRLGDILAV